MAVAPADSSRSRRLRAGVHVRQNTRHARPGRGRRRENIEVHLPSIEGDPDSPISQGNLCPKGAASHQLVTQPDRVTKIKYRAPYAKEWTELDTDKAMDMIADRVWEARKKDWIRTKDGIPVNHTENIAHLGGATLDNEENYLIKKLFTGWPGHGVRVQPGPNMTLLHGAQFGYLLR